MSKFVKVGIFLIAVSTLLVAGIQAEDRSFVFVEEGVYEFTTEDGITGRGYVGETGFEKRIVELRELASSIGELGEIDNAATEQLKLIAREIHELESALERSNLDPRRESFKSGDCGATEPTPIFVPFPPYGMAGVGMTTRLKFTGVGSCQAYGIAHAYVSTPNDTDTNTVSTGGYVSVVDLQAGAAVPPSSNACKYGSVYLYFNDSTPLLHETYDLPTGCYSCPGCS